MIRSLHCLIFFINVLRTFYIRLGGYYHSCQYVLSEYSNPVSIITCVSPIIIPVKLMKRVSLVHFRNLFVLMYTFLFSKCLFPFYKK
jgi:hypothetical protein